MASKNLAPLADPEDMFADTRMSFGDHIEDLRSHLLRAIVGFIAAMFLCVLPPIGPWAIEFVTSPVKTQLVAFYDRYYANRFEKLGDRIREETNPVLIMLDVPAPMLKAAFEGKIPNDANRMAAVDVEKLTEADWIKIPVKIDFVALSKTLNDINRKVRPESLTTFTVQEMFVVYFKVGILVGFVISSPWVFYQLWSFVAAGLYPHEKRLVNYYLPVSVGLFLAGVFLCEFFALPKAIEALLYFNEWLEVTPELRLSEWLSFAIIMPLIFGISFQTPIVMLFMFKVGVADIQTFRNKRRISIFIMAVFSAVITPTPDIVNWLMLWLPMCLLYEVGIGLCMLQPKSLSEEMDDAELDEMVGV